MQYDLLINSAITRASSNGSIRQAALKIGIPDTSLGQFKRWRESNVFPSESTLLKIADLAQFDKIKSHFAIMAVKTKDPDISKAYEDLASK